MKKIILTLFLISLSLYAIAQDDLLGMLEDKNEVTYTKATFKGTRLINGHSVETRKKNTLDFIISHRFGELSSGSYELFGLDQSNIRIGLDYGVTDRFSIGIGRNSFEKTYDGYMKLKLLKQSKGGKVMPVSMSLFSSMAIKTLRNNNYELDFKNKVTYSYQLLLARKFSSSFSLQLMPTYVHVNTITPEQDNNDVYGLGAGGRIKLTQRLSLNAEYYYQMQTLTESTYNSFAIGFDIETGGHVFQFHLTNSQAMIEKGFFAETNNDFFSGDIHFGFNISRSFQLNSKKR